LFLGFGYEVNVPFNFRSQKTQTGMQVSSAILFHLLLFHRFIFEKALSKMTNIEHIFSARSVKRGQLPGSSIFSNCFPGISVVFPVCLLVFGAVMPLQIKNSFGTDITCNLTRHCAFLQLLLAKKYLSFQLELKFLFSPDIYLSTLIFC